jgi:hypothetical protein
MVSEPQIDNPGGFMTDIIYGVNFGPVAVESEQTEGDVEARLKSEIASLWSAHRLTEATAKHSKEELKTMRLDLGQKLCQMKSILARTGRSGGWAAYLRSQDLPRATAERYIDRHEALLNPDTKRVTETIPEPDEEDVRRLVRHLLPRLRRVLTTSSWLQWFLAELEHQWETAAAGSTGERANETAPVAKGDPGDLNGTEVTGLSAAA